MSEIYLENHEEEYTKNWYQIMFHSWMYSRLALDKFVVQVILVIFAVAFISTYSDTVKLPYDHFLLALSFQTLVFFGLMTYINRIYMDRAMKMFMRGDDVSVGVPYKKLLATMDFLAHLSAIVTLTFLWFIFIGGVL